MQRCISSVSVNRINLGCVCNVERKTKQTKVLTNKEKINLGSIKMTESNLQNDKTVLELYTSPF